MYYKTNSNRYYKIKDRKSVRVPLEEANSNLFKINDLTLKEMKKLSEDKIENNKGMNKQQLIPKFIDLIKKSESFEREVRIYLNENTRNKEKTGKPKPGDLVKIIVKPYDRGVVKVGIVKDVLTKKQEHTRGHKVRLFSDEVGRLIKIIKKK